MVDQIEVNIVADAEVSGLDDLKDKLEDIKTTADNTSKDISSSLSELESSFEEATAKVEELEEALDQAQFDGDDIEVDIISDQLAEAREEAEELQSQIDAINGEALSDTSSDADELTESTTNSKEEVDELQSSLDAIEGTALLAAAGQISQLGTEAENMSQDMNRAAITVGQLSKQAGVAEPEMISLINTISNATFPNEEAMQYVQLLDQLNVPSDKLAESATNMDRINDAFQIGSDKVVQLTGNLQAIGVSADNLPSSFNALAYAQSNVAGGVDKFNTVLQRMGPLFSEYGYNVDQAAVITGAATQKWGSGRKALSNLSEILKETNGDTRALEEALDLESGSLSNASDITGQYAGQVQNLADEEAEHKTIIDQLGAAWEDLSLSLSPILSPLTSVMGVIGDVGGYAVGINGIINLAKSFRGLELAEKAHAIATKASAFAQWLLNAAMSANPIVLVVLAIIALIAILTYLYFNNEQVRQAIDGLGQTFIKVGQIIYTTVMNFINWVISSLQGFYNYIMTLGGLLTSNVSITGNNIIDSILMFLAFLATLPIQVGIYLVNTIAKVLGFGDNFVQKLTQSAVNAVRNFMAQISSLPGRFMNELNRMLSAVYDWAATLPQKFWEAGVNAVKNFLAALGIASPGTMQRMLVWEITEMGKQVPEKSKALISNVSEMGSNIVDAYGNPKFNNNDLLINSNVNNNGSGAGNPSFNITFEGCTFDKRERVNEVLEILENYFNWDNITAGRKV